jgi:ELWxxDGT repeat protein
MVGDIYPGSTGSSPAYLTNVNGTLYFSADGELWKSDGTTNGTVMVKDIYPGEEESSPEELTEVNGVLFLSADDGVHGRELWVSDGTTDGTIMVKDIYPGSDEGYPNESEPEVLTNVNGLLFFSADDGFHVHGRELWVSDGTPDGTVLVKDILPMDKDDNGSGPRDLTEANGMLFFSADDGIHGSELWALKVDGGCANCIFLPIIQK